MYHVAVCDDELAICSVVEKHVLSCQKFISERFDTEVFTSGRELKKYLDEGHPVDLLFLDIELGDIDGVEIGVYIREVLRNEALLIVYISAKESYYRQLFEVRPMHFLLKPIVGREVEQDVQKALYLTGVSQKSFTYKKGKGVERILIGEILYFESQGRKIMLCGQSRSDTFYATIQEVSEKVGCYRFLQPHRSYIVNYDHIVGFDNNQIELTNGDKIPIARSNWMEFTEKQMQYEMQKE